MSRQPLTVVLADDHTLVRAGIRSLLESIGGVKVLAETGDGQEALRLVEMENPDLVLLDITLPGLNGLEVVGRIGKLGLKTHVLMVSMHTGPEYVARALSAGAVGYLVKDSAVSELEQALEAIAAGRTYLSAAIDREVVEGFLRSRRGTASELAVLTPRQVEILQLIAEGHATRVIADRLHISVKTVETHRAQIMERLGVSDVPSLVRVAIRSGLVAPES